MQMQMQMQVHTVTHTPLEFAVRSAPDRKVRVCSGMLLLRSGSPSPGPPFHSQDIPCLPRLQRFDASNPPCPLPLLHQHKTVYVHARGHTERTSDV